MAKNYVCPGNVMDYVNTGDETIESGSGVDVNGRFGVALDDIKSGEAGSVQFVGVFELSKSSAAFAQGATVYFKNAGIVASETDAIEAGFVWKPAVAGDDTVQVKIG